MRGPHLHDEATEVGVEHVFRLLQVQLDQRHRLVELAPFSLQFLRQFVQLTLGQLLHDTYKCDANVLQLHVCSFHLQLTVSARIASTDSLCISRKSSAMPLISVFFGSAKLYTNSAPCKMAFLSTLYDNIDLRPQKHPNRSRSC